MSLKYLMVCDQCRREHGQDEGWDEGPEGWLAMQLALRHGEPTRVDFCGYECAIIWLGLRQEERDA